MFSTSSEKPRITFRKGVFPNGTMVQIRDKRMDMGVGGEQ